MLIKCDILKYALLFPGRTNQALCKLLSASQYPLIALLHCCVAYIPLLGHNPNSNKYRVIISARDILPERGLRYFGFCLCMCLKEWHIITSGLFVFPLLISTGSPRCHWQTQHLLLFPLQIFSTWALFLTYNCWVSCYGKQLFQSSRLNKHSLCSFDVGNIC